MNKQKKAKILLLAYLIVMALIFLATLTYATTYANIRMNYGTNSDGSVYVYNDTKSVVGSNANLFTYFSEVTDPAFPFVRAQETDVQLADGSTITRVVMDSEIVDKVLNFQKTLSSTNELLMILSLVSLCLVVILFVFSNQSRRIYYKSNLIVGVLVPIAISALMIVCIVSNMAMMGIFNSDVELYNLIAILMQSNYTSTDIAKNYLGNYAGVKAMFNINSVAFIIYTVVFALAIAYSAFIAIYSIRRYNKCREEREQIIAKAVASND